MLTLPTLVKDRQRGVHWAPGLSVVDGTQTQNPRSLVGVGGNATSTGLACCGPLAGAAFSELHFILWEMGPVIPPGRVTGRMGSRAWAELRDPSVAGQPRSTAACPT